MKPRQTHRPGCAQQPRDPGIARRRGRPEYNAARVIPEEAALMARLKIGFIPIEGGHYYREALEEVTRAEALGFDSVWMEEHHSVTDHYWPSPLTVLAGFSPPPANVMLGTNILVPAFYPPPRLAPGLAPPCGPSPGRITARSAIRHKPDEVTLFRVGLPH